MPKGTLSPKQSVAASLQPKEIKGNGCSCEHRLCTCIKSKSPLHDMHWGDCQPLSACSELRREKKSPQIYSDFHGKCKLLKNIGHALWDSETGTGLGNTSVEHTVLLKYVEYYVSYQTANLGWVDGYVGKVPISRQEDLSSYLHTHMTACAHPSTERRKQEARWGLLAGTAESASYRFRES